MLRLLWAKHLAEIGEMTQAVAVVWPVKEARSLAEAWIELVLEAGGEAGARMGIRQLFLLPERYDSALPGLRQLLRRQEPEELPERLAAAVELLALSKETRSAGLPPRLRPIARLACRAMVRDAGNGLTVISRSDCERLARLSGDGTLSADLPALYGGLREPSPPQASIRFQASETGSLVPRDLAALPGGRHLVALGAAGVLLLARDGRRVAHFDVAADALIVSDAGTRALTLARRGQQVTLAKIELDRRRCWPWGEMAIDCYAENYDGSFWFAAHQDVLYVLDALAKEPQALWRLSDVGQRVAAMTRQSTHYLSGAAHK